MYSLSFQSSGGTAGGSGAGLLASVSFDWMTLLWDPRRYVGEEKSREEERINEIRIEQKSMSPAHTTCRVLCRVLYVVRHFSKTRRF